MSPHKETTSSSRAKKDSTASKSDVRRLQHAISPDTIASRVERLQSIRRSSHPELPSAPTKRRREYSRTGFGHRVASRFAQPASRNEMPNENPDVESNHSFLGLTSARTNHRQEHSISVYREQYARTPGLNGIIEPVGLVPTTQYYTVGPWTAVPSTTSGRSLRENSGHDIESNVSTNYHAYNPPTVHRADETYLERPEHHRQAPKPRMRMMSDQSFITSSTGRRQSVLELFHQYGIDRPTGLVSEASSRGPDAIFMQTGYKTCHVCLWLNQVTNQNCSRCTHLLCVDCVADTTSMVPRKQPNLARELSKQEKDANDAKPVPPKKGKSPVETKRSLREPTRLTPAALETRKNTQYKGNVSSRKETLLANPRSQNIQSSKQSFHGGSTSNTPVLLPHLDGTRACKSISDSPFLIADLNSRIDSQLRLSAVSGTESRHHNLHQNSSRKHHHNYNKRRVAAFTTESGYTADTSHVGDEVRFQFHSRTTSRSSQSNCQAPEAHKPDSNSTLCAGATREHEVSAYIECHGYPRTGHARHGNTSSGLKGECQHCMDDCQCTACQRTHHNVRCCVNEDHKSVIHQHLTQALPAESPDPLDCAASTLHDISHEAALQIPACSNNTVIPPMLGPASRNLRAKPKPAPVIEQAIAKESSHAGGCETAPPRRHAIPKNSIVSQRIEKFNTPSVGVPSRTDVKMPCGFTRPKKPTSPISKFAGLGRRKDQTSSNDELRPYKQEYTEVRQEREAVKYTTDADKAPLQKRLLPKPICCDEEFSKRKSEHKLSEDMTIKQPAKVKVAKRKEHRLSDDETVKRGVKPRKEHRLSEDEKIKVALKNDTTTRKELHFSEDEAVQVTTSARKEQTLSEDMLVQEIVFTRNSQSLSADETVVRTSAPTPRVEASRNIEDEEEHECVWKHRFLDDSTCTERRESIDISTEDLVGITVIIHMKGKEDLVIRTDLRNEKESISRRKGELVIRTDLRRGERGEPVVAWESNDSLARD